MLKKFEIFGSEIELELEECIPGIFQFNGSAMINGQFMFNSFENKYYAKDYMRGTPYVLIESISDYIEKEIYNQYSWFKTEVKEFAKQLNTFDPYKTQLENLAAIKDIIE